jgi:hypothetical protein
MTGKIPAKNIPLVVLAFLLIFIFNINEARAGLFGAPQTVSREAGGLNTAIGYWYHEDTYANGADYKFRQNTIYSQAAYGADGIWEIYARLGISDLKIFDLFSSGDAATATDKDDFKENWKFFGTLGAKIFYPVNKVFGMGAFVQGTYYLSNFTDNVSGVSGGTPFRADLKVKNLWDVNCGIGFQATLPNGTRFYAGPYVLYSEALMSLSARIPGMEGADGNSSVESKAMAGGFAGMEIPLPKGFRLNVEGQYADGLSIGAAVSFTY